MTADKVLAVRDAIRAIGETIRDLSAASPLGGVPSGELYAHLMPTLTIEQYTAVIGLLKGAQLVEERAHLLVWIGPTSTRSRS